MGTRMRKLVMAVLLALAEGFALAATAPAAEWPTRPIRIIAPSTPGGIADLFASNSHFDFSCCRRG